MLSEGNWKSLITFYENQPWEKLQVLAARAQGVKTVGIQTTNFSRYYLSYALGKGERERMPLPDRIGSSGSSAHQLLLDCGSPAEVIKRCGALRYGDLLRGENRNGSNRLVREGQTQVLVVLSIDPVLSRHLLEGLAEAFPDGGEGDGLSFTIRPHPMYPVPASWVRFPAKMTGSGFTGFRESLSRCDLVLFTASTVGFEAQAEGKPALRYRSPRLFDVDDLYGSHLPVVTDSNLREAVLKPAAAHPDNLSWISDFFAPVDHGQLQEIFRW